MIPLQEWEGRYAALQHGFGFVGPSSVEAQSSVYRAGVGAPGFQVFTGLKIQFPPSVSISWNFEVFRAPYFADVSLSRVATGIDLSVARSCDARNAEPCFSSGLHFTSARVTKLQFTGPPIER
jgi:hypothetical protein